MSASAPATTADARGVLARHGRSFHWASRLLGAREADRAARLYAFCRTVDDLVDEDERGDARERLERLRADLRRGASDDPAVASFLELAADCGLPQGVVELVADIADTQSR